MAAAELCYPDDDIVNFLSYTFEMQVTIQDLRQLKPDFVQKIYCNFLLDFYPSLDQITQLPFDVCKAVQQHPHVYASLGRTMVLAKVINDFLKNINKDVEFVPADLFDPKPTRTRRFFSVLIDFYVCAKDNVDQLCAIEEQAKLKLEAKEELKKTIAKNEEKLRQLKSEKEENQIREEEMLKRIAEAKGRIQKLQANKINLKTQFDQKKVDIASYTTKIKTAELELLEKKDRVKILASQVVQDSERKELEERENLLATYRNDNSLRAEKLASLKQTLQTSKSALDLINNELMPVLQEIQQDVAIKKELSIKITQHERETRACLEETEDYDMKIHQLKEVLSSRQEKISQLHIAWNLKKDVLQGELAQCKATMLEICRSRTEDEIATQALKKENMQIIKEMQQFKDQINQFDILVATNYHNILQAMEKHNNEVQTSLAPLLQAVNADNPAI